MSASKYLLFLSFVTIIVCAFAQWAGYPYYGSGYPNNGYSSYQSPCQSPCGNIRRTSSCQYLPCYSQNQYYSPYYYNNRQYYNPYGYLYPGSRTSSTGQYANGYIYPNTRTLSSDPYANVPVEIIGDGASNQRVRLQGINPQNEYANVPVEIIDENDYINFWKNAPKLPPHVKQTLQNDVSVNNGTSNGTITSRSITQSKPVTITRTVPTQLLRKNPIVNLDFVNGEHVAENKEEEDQKVEKSKQNSTETESEDVSAVKSWF